MTLPITQRRQLLESRQLHISCVVPVHNEAEGIARFLAELQTALEALTDRVEILVVDDGSKDDSLSVVAGMVNGRPLKAISMSRNFGKESALTAGMTHASGDVTILIDADFQHPFDTMAVFVDHWAQGYDMVYGVRTSRDGESGVKKAFSNLFYALTDRVNETPIPKNAGDFRLMDREVVHAILTCGERNRFMKGLYAWVGFQSIGVPFEVQARETGESSWGFRNLVALALDGIFSYSNVPLRVWGFVGLTISSLSVAYGAWVIFSTLYYGKDTPGFATLVVAITFLGGVQLLSVGILGEYVGRIFTEVKGRPNYIIATKIGFAGEASIPSAHAARAEAS